MTAFPERAGLQPERTALAWQRTSITALIVLIPSIAVSLRLGQPLLTAGGACAALASTVLVLAVRRRLVQLGDDTRGYSPYPPMVRVATVTVLGGLGGAAVGVAAFLR